MTVYLTNLADLEAVNEVYTTFFPDSAIARRRRLDLPARSVISAAALPLGARCRWMRSSPTVTAPPQQVEDRHNLRSVPAIPTRRREARCTPRPWPSPTTTISPAGCRSTWPPAKVLTGCVREQTAQCLRPYQLLWSIGHVMDDIVKVNIQLKNIEDLEAVNAIYTQYFPGYHPARTVIGVSEPFAGALVQMDAVMSNAESTPPQA